MHKEKWILNALEHFTAIEVGTALEKHLPFYARMYV